jgi:drug/metabolite transporter (DMT)-like permease
VLATRNSQPATPLVHFVLLGVALLFTANYLISKVAMREIAPLAFAWVRVAGSAVILSLLAGQEGAPRLSGRDAWRVALYALLAVALNQTLFLSGLAFTTVQAASILVTSIPVFAVAAAILMGRERPSAMRVGGIGLACAGALLVVGREGFAGTHQSLVGAVMIIANCLCYALYLVLSKPDMARLSPKRVVARMFVIGTALMLPICAIPLRRQDWRAVSPRAWVALVIVILGPTVLAYLMQAWALRHADSSVVAVYTYVQPVLATILGAILFGEQIGLLIVLAAAMIFSGVWLAQRSG